MTAEARPGSRSPPRGHESIRWFLPPGRERTAALARLPAVLGERVVVSLSRGAEELAGLLRGLDLEVAFVAPPAATEAGSHPPASLWLVEWKGKARPVPADPAGPAWIAVVPDPAAAAAALRAGAEAVWPELPQPELIRAHVLRALVRQRAEREARTTRLERARADSRVLEGDSPAAQRLRETLARVSATPRTTILVRGPLGAPLAELARLIHARSARAEGPLVELEAAGTATERWREVLGRGDLPGTAEGGSVVVHEVARLDAAGQAALAERLDPRAEGGPRLIATTSRDLAAEVEAGRLREDLAYRLNVLTLVVPGLDERREDVAALAAGLGERAARALGRSPRRLGPDERAALARRPWPGDLAELDLYMCTRELLGLAPAAPAHPTAALPTGLGTPETLVVGDRSLKAVEEALIRRVLEETGGNKLRSAEILGIHRTTLYAKLAAYGLGTGDDL